MGYSPWGCKESDTTEPLTLSLSNTQRVPRELSGKDFTCQCKGHRRCKFDPWVGKIPWRRKWRSTPENPMDRGA